MAGRPQAVAALLLALLAMPAAAEEAPASLAACGMAATLLGTVVFMMSVFYLLNHSDDDMRRYSANVVSSTISIFCAVLMFQALNGFIEEQLGMEEWDDTSQFALDAVHMLLWFVLMQCALAKCSGAMLTDEQKKEEHLEIRKLDMKCYATLLAHMTGFAAINAFAQLQQCEFFASHALVSFGVIPIALVSMYAMQRATDTVRERIALGDGIKDDFETLWDEETEEAENDVMGLVLSFTAVQSFRFLVGGFLPNVEGAEEKEELLSHSLIQKLILLGVAVLFAVVTFLSVYLENEGTAEHLVKTAEHVRAVTPDVGGKEPLLGKTDTAAKYLGKDSTKEMKSKFLDAIGDEEAFDRLKEALGVAASMTMAWCFFFAGRWFLSGTPSVLSDDTESHSDMMMLTLLQALVLSMLSFSLIRVLDMIEDAHRGTGQSENVEKGIEQIIKALGILVGFAWEQCFDTSVSAISSRLSNPSEFKLLFAVFVFVVLVPAWKWWILPMDVCWGWKNPALAQIQNEEDLEKFIAQLKLDFEEKQKKEEENEEVADVKDDAKLHREGHDNITREHLHRGSGMQAAAPYLQVAPARLVPVAEKEAVGAESQAQLDALEKDKELKPSNW